MHANLQSRSQNPAAAIPGFARAVPLAITLLVWLFAATMETGYGSFLADTAPEEMAEILRKSKPETNG